LDQNKDWGTLRSLHETAKRNELVEGHVQEEELKVQIG